MTDTAEHEAVETYRDRRRALLSEAYQAEASHRPELAAELRNAAHALLLAIVNEQSDQPPEPGGPARYYDTQDRGT